MTTAYDAVVVGAGPYGLSTAAHLLGRGLRVAVFGKTLEMWRDHMPKGMWLRSHWWATNLSDPRKDYAFEDFFKDASYEKGYPVPIETFINYGLWFQRRAVPVVDETYVASIERQDGQFLITLEDGREVKSQVVVMAIGLSHYAHWPERYQGFPAELVSHSSDHADFERFKGRDVVVIGGGQSAIEFAALLHEAGAAVQVVSRRPIWWLAPDRMNARTTLERIRAPKASIAPGWINWVLDHMPYFFYRFPQAWKDSYNAQYHSGATDWLRDRVIGNVILREGQTVTNLKVVEGKLDVAISDGANVRDGDIEFPFHHLQVRHRLAFAQYDVADDSIPQPVRRPRVVLGVVRILPRLGEAVEEIRHMVQDPIDPAGRNAGLRSPDPFKGGARVHPIWRKPPDGPPRYNLDSGAGFVEQRRKLYRALSTTD